MGHWLAGAGRGGQAAPDEADVATAGRTGRTGRIESRVPVDARRMRLIERHAHGDGPLTAAAAVILRAEGDVVHAAVSPSASLGAQNRGVRPHASRIGAGVAVTDAIGRLILRDTRDGDPDRTADRVGY